jgi:peptide/nickel transport system substrate-binding protein
MVDRQNRSNDAPQPSDQGGPGFRLTRAEVLKGGLAAGAALTVGGLLSACGGASSTGGGGSTGGTTAPGAAPAASTGARGGTFRVGVVGNGTQETFSPIQANSEIDLAHVVQVFESMQDYTDSGHVRPLLAEEITPNAALDVWTIRLRPEVEFHDGRPLTAKDVIYTYNFNLDPKNGSTSTENLSHIARMKALDARTVQITLKQPNRFFGPLLADYRNSIIPEGTTVQDLARNPIGTGPFKLVRFVPGERAELVRNENYWQHGKPYVDELQIISIDDPQARVNALLSGQVDAIADASPVQLTTIEGAGMKILESRSAGWMGNYMMTSGKDAAPFDQVEVRQAMRLLVDREQVKENAFLGHAELANDIYGIQEPFYPDLPQRAYDPEQAKALLKKAGMEGLTVDLWTGNLTNGLLEFCTLFANTAKAGGVTVNLHNQEPGRYFTSSYMQQPFGSTYWTGRPFYELASENLAANAAVNETAWTDPEWQKLFREAAVVKDEKTSEEMLAKSEEILYERGGYMIPVFPNFLDAYQSHVTGLHRSIVYELGYFNFREVSVNS